MFFLKTLFLCVNLFQPVGADTEDCRIELEPRSGVLEPREEKSITVHFIANRTVGAIEPRHEIPNNVVCAISKASYQPVHSLTRAFASRLCIL